MKGERSRVPGCRFRERRTRPAQALGTEELVVAAHSEHVAAPLNRRGCLGRGEAHDCVGAARQAESLAALTAAAARCGRKL